MSQIKPYTKIQKKLHTDIQKLITEEPYKSMDADEVLVVFGRIYSVYALEYLKEHGIIKFTNKQNPKRSVMMEKGEIEDGTE